MEVERSHLSDLPHSYARWLHRIVGATGLANVKHAAKHTFTSMDAPLLSLLQETQAVFFSQAVSKTATAMPAKPPFAVVEWEVTA